jgi:predicted membrane channel-forming protein YqfA (hemolysin III family)
MNIAMISKPEPYRLGAILIGLILAVWVFACPWVIDDAAVQPAALNFYITGGLFVILSILALVRSDDLPEYGIMAVAAWLAASPWILDLPGTVTRQAVLYAVVLAILAWTSRPSFKPKSVAA